jgi:NAD(P)H dehydrogenase (quinone)
MAGMTQSAGLIAVTGSTGQIGGRVAAALAKRGVEQRLVVRDPSRAPDYAGVEVRRAEYADKEAAIEALKGADVLFMVSGSENEARLEEHRTFVNAAVEAGVRRIVYTSFFGAAPDATFTLARDHYATEEHIKATPLQWTFLRDNLYLDFFPMFAGEDGVIRGPAADGRVAAVAQDDVAACAVAVLAGHPVHAQTTYSLTGPEAISMEEAAETLTRLTGRLIRYHAETIEEAYASRAQYGAARWQVDAWVSTYVAIANGELAAVTDDVERLSGHPPLSLERLLSRSADGP